MVRRAEIAGLGDALGGRRRCGARERRRRRAHERKEKAAEARVEEVIDKDPTDDIVYTNLKH